MKGELGEVTLTTTVLHRGNGRINIMFSSDNKRISKVSYFNNFKLLSRVLQFSWVICIFDYHLL